MKNEQIGKVLKKYRKLNALSVDDVILELSEKYGVNVAEKTVYGWESNQSSPTSPMLIALCDIYKINNITELFTEVADQKGFFITAEERQLVENYRKNPHLQEAVRLILGLQD